MIVGVPKEIKVHESRVAITPEGVSEFVHAGHTVIIQDNAGTASAITNEDFIQAGATIVATADDVWQKADLVLKVKEPIESEYSKMRKGQTLFTYLHLAASKACTDALVASGTTAIAYETVEVNGTLPLLAPMSEVAGRLAAQVGATALQKPHGGRGVLLGGVPGVAPGRVVVIGGGVAGLNAAVIALGMGADITVFDRSINRLQYIDTVYGGRIKTLVASKHAIEREVKQADLVIGAVLVHGAKAPKLISNALVAHCVANMPGAVPVASTYALTNATLPYALSLANNGWEAACKKDPNLAKGLNVHDGKIYYSAVAEAHGYPSVEL
jgi:alanine dehydrogenase